MPSDPCLLPFKGQQTLWMELRWSSNKTHDCKNTMFMQVNQLNFPYPCLREPLGAVPLFLLHGPT